MLLLISLILSMKHIASCSLAFEYFQFFFFFLEMCECTCFFGLPALIDFIRFMFCPPRSDDDDAS